MSDEMETWKTKVFKLDERLDSLEKKFELLEKSFKGNTNTDIDSHVKFANQIAELKKSIKSQSGESYTATMHNLGIQINELKERLDRHNEGIKFFSDQSNINKEVLLNFLKVFNDEYFCNQEWYEKQLEKFDSKGKKREEYNRKLMKWFNGKIKDSEVLKDIKKLAKAESDFYDKHGYFSFWSDRLKAQRIKELKGNKQFDDYSKVQNLINDPLNDLKPKKQTDIGEITLLHEDSEKRILQIKKDLEDESIMGHPIIYTNDEMKELLKEKRPEPLINSDLETVFPKEKPETLGDLFTPMEETEPDHIFICKGCGKKIFISGMNKLKGSYYCSECNPEPEKFPKIVYQLGTDSKEYVELKEKYDKLTEEIQTDLDELIAWANNYPKDSEIYIRIKRKREKWQGRVK